MDLPTHWFLCAVLFQLIYSPILTATYEGTPRIRFSSNSKNIVIDVVQNNITYFKLIDNSTFVLTAQCTAEYPVQWNIVASPFKTKLLENRRDYNVSSDPKTFVFSTTLEILVENHFFTGKIEEFSYSCQCTVSECLKDNLYIHSPFTDNNFVLVATNPTAYIKGQAKKCNWTNDYDMKVDLQSYPLRNDTESGKTAKINSEKIELKDSIIVSQLLVSRNLTCLAHENIFSKGSVMGYKSKGSSTKHNLNGEEMMIEIHSEKYYQMTAVLPERLNGTVEYFYCSSPLWNSYGWWTVKSSTNQSPMSTQNVTKVVPVKNLRKKSTTDHSDPSNDFIHTFDSKIQEIRDRDNFSSVSVLYLILAVVVLVALCLVLSAFTWILLSIRKRRLLESNRWKKLLPEHQTLMTPRNSCVKIEEPISWNEILRSDLTVDEATKLGEGNFGLVLKGTLRTGSGVVDVAVKKPLRQDAFALSLFKKELRITSKIGHHKNIIKVFGAVMANCNYETNICYVVLEYCALGNLRGHLRKHKSAFEPVNFEEAAFNNHIAKSSPMISTMTLVSWSLDIAEGMDFLGRHKIVHGDLAARNILLSADKSIKLSDFGLSKELQEYYYHGKRNETPMPWKWMSYESLKHQKFSTKSDIWSYGVTLWEIFTLGDIPWVGVNCIEFIENLEAGLRPPKPIHAPNEIYDLMRECWALETTCRPHFAAIAEKLQSFSTKCSLQSAMRLHNRTSSNDSFSNYYLTPTHNTMEL